MTLIRIFILMLFALSQSAAQVSIPFPGPGMLSSGVSTIAFVRTGNSGFNSGSFTSSTLSFNATGCSFLVILNELSGSAGTPSARSATFNGVPMTEVPGSLVTGGAGGAAIMAFSLAAPTTGTNNISVSWGTVTYTRSTLGAWCFAGGTNAISSVQIATTGTATSAVTSDTSSIVLAGQANSNGTASTLTSGTTDWSGNVGGGYGASGGRVSGAASVTPTWSNSENALLAFSIK